LYWASSCTGYAVQQDGSPKLGISYDEMTQLTASAFAHWPAAMCGDAFPSISVQSLGAAACDRLEYNPTGPNANVVMFRDQNWPHDPSFLALTTVSFDVNSGKILDADMEINSAFLLDAGSLRYVLTHESGHFFGLDHSIESSAVMFAHYTLPGPDAPDPILTADDVAAICAAYPTTRVATACNFEPERGFSPLCGGDVTGGCGVGARARGRAGSTGAGMAALGLLGAALAFSRARRRRRTPKPALKPPARAN
jgi:hypothetical protein